MADASQKGRYAAAQRRGKNARLDERKVALVRQRVAAGTRQKDIALVLGVHPSLVSRIVRREKWRTA